MKKYFFLILMMLSFATYGQDTNIVKIRTVTYTPMTSLGYKFKFTKFDSAALFKAAARFDDSVQIKGLGFVSSTPADGDSSMRIPNTGWVKRNVTGGGGSGGSIEYVKPGRYTLVDSSGRNYTINVDTAGLFTIIRQEIHDSISGINLDDTVYAKQPLYVDAGVKDTLKFNADSSGLVKNSFISGGNLYQVVNGDTSLVGSVGGSAGALTWLDVARNSFDVDENRSHLIFDSAINFELYKKFEENYSDFGINTIDTLNGNNLYGSMNLYPGNVNFTTTGNIKGSFINVNTDSVLIALNPDFNINKQHGFYLKDSIAKLLNNTLIYETPPNGASTDKIVSWNGSTGVVGVVDRDSLFVFNADSSGLVKDVMRSSDSVYIKINGVWVFAFIDSVGSGGGGGSVDYVLQGWGIKVDSTGRNYTVKADSSVLATLYKVQQDSLAIVGNMWKLGGNTGINDSTKFIGTTDKKALNFRVNGRRSGFIDSTSTNTIFGYGALQNVTSGLTNTVVGYESLKANTTGGANAAIGYRALLSNTTGASNFAAGREALRSNTTGGGNFGMGFFALYSNVSGSYNIAIGNSALQNNTTSNNLAIGNNAALNNTTGGVVAVGYEALKANTTGLSNTAIGLNSLWSNTTSSNNTAIGAQALYYSTGQGNTTVGSKGLLQNSTGEYNTAIGVNSLYGNTTTYGNTAIGNSALFSNGNTVTGLGAITGGSGYTNGTYTNVTMITIPSVGAAEFPVANITVSGGAVTAVTLVSGGAGVVQATSLSATAAQIGGTGSGFSVLITSFNPGGNYSTAIGDSAAANQRRGNANIAIGAHVALPDTTAGKQLNIGNVIFGTGTYDGTSMSSTATSDSRVSIGTNTQPASAILTLSSTDKGFLPPRMTGSQAEGIASPAEGLVIYSTDGSGSTITSKGWWGYDGSTWTKFN